MSARTAARPTRPPISSIRIRRSRTPRRCGASPSTTSSSSAISPRCCANGSKAAARARPRYAPSWPNGSRRACRTGTSRATRPTSASRSPTRRENTFTCGSMRPSAISAASRHCATKRGLNYDEYFKADSTTELYHFIGKDISYFHNLFWPAVLHGSGCRKPTAVFVHGFLTINGAEDVQVARHLHHRAQVPVTAAGRAAAVLLRQQARRRPWKTSTFRSMTSSHA